ncbi:MAG: DUF3857 domain-containing protein [Kaistella sp.]|nr:DUF3857 domain-containing protein [Kaistella sp.]
MKKYWLFLGSFLPFLFFSQDYSVASIPETLKKDANAIIRNQHSEYLINAVDDISVSENTTITILNNSGEDYAQVVIPYDKMTKVSDIKVNVFDASGKVIKSYSKKDFSDFSHTPSFGLYVDDRVLVLNPSPSKFPFTVQYTYTVKTKNTVFIQNLSPVPGFNVSAESISRKISNKSGINLRTKVVNNDFGKVSTTGSGTDSEYVYRNIGAINREPSSPSLEYLAPKVEFALDRFSLEGKEGLLTDWNSFGKWYFDNLLVPTTIITPEIRAEVDALKLSGSTEEKVRKIYQYMQDKTRYVFVSMGIGGWKPMNADEVRQKAYGDCKALTNYMRAMLEAANIKSYYSVIKSDLSPEKFDPDFPKMAGNHVILMVPTEDGNIWLENTSQNIAFNHLSLSTTNRNVLCVKSDGIDLINTPVYSAADSKEVIKAKIKLKEDNSIDATADFNFTGSQYDFNMGLVGLSNTKLTDQLKDKYDILKIKNIEVQNFKNDRNNAVISYLMKISAADYSKKLGNDLFFRIMPFYEQGTYNANDERRLPFENVFAYEDDYEIEFEIPAGYKLDEIPPSTVVESEFGSYHLSFKTLENKLTVNRKLVINKGVYPKDKYLKYIEFRKRTSNQDNTKILITKTL